MDETILGGCGCARPQAPVCVACDDSPGQCSCRTCDSCEAVIDDGDDCSNCDSCESCCSCSTCNCGERVDNGALCSSCEQCEGCCNCFTCYRRGCGRHNPDDVSQCDTCERCDNCCECSVCEACECRCGRDDTFCGNCDRCGDCCCCDEEEDGDCSAVPFVNRPLLFHAAGRKQLARNPSKRFVSLEIEVSDIDYNGGQPVNDICHRRSHSVMRDGSLPDTGFEICTAPASGDVFVANIEELCGCLDRHNAKADSDCGLHCHVDARDFNYWDLRRLVRLYAVLEDGLFLCVAPSRKRSSMCKPCGGELVSRWQGKTVKDGFAASVYGRGVTSTHLRSKKGYKYDSARYSALNLHSWVMRGTVECRMHHGTVSARKAYRWGVLWAGIVDAAARMSDQQVEALRASRRSSFDLLLDIAPTDEVRQHLVQRAAKLHNFHQTVTA